MKSILFSQAEYNRKKEFTVLTQLLSENVEKFVTKQAIYKEGEEYINKIFDNYKLLNKKIQTFKLPKTILVGNVLKSEYIDEPNLASQIENLLIEGKIGEANNKVKEFIDFLNTIPIVNDNPYNYPEFIRQFDPKKEHLIKIATDCWFPGFHDVNFDNFIKKVNDYYFVDFEWVFEVAIPKDYLILRSIFYLSVKLNRIIAGLISEEFKCVSFFPNVLTPFDWLNQTNHSLSDIQRMFDYEFNIFSSKFRNFNKYPKIPKDFNKTIFTDPVKPNEHEITVVQTQNDLLSKKVGDLEEELVNIKKQLQETADINQKTSEHLDYLNQKYSKYNRKAYRIFENFETSRVGQSRMLKTFGNLLFKFFSKVRGQ